MSVLKIWLVEVVRSCRMWQWKG